MGIRPMNIDRKIDPTADQVRALRDRGPDGPIVMVNLLKFRRIARYEGDVPPCSGQEAYARYQHDGRGNGAARSHHKHAPFLGPSCQ